MIGFVQAQTCYPKNNINSKLVLTQVIKCFVFYIECHGSISFSLPFLKNIWIYYVRHVELDKLYESNSVKRGGKKKPAPLP